MKYIKVILRDTSEKHRYTENYTTYPYNGWNTLVKCTIHNTCGNGGKYTAGSRVIRHYSLRIAVSVYTPPQLWAEWCHVEIKSVFPIFHAYHYVKKKCH